MSPPPTVTWSNNAVDFTEIEKDVDFINLRDGRQRDAVSELYSILHRPPSGQEGDVYKSCAVPGLFDDVSALVRYLRARQWDVQKASEMMRATARWREQFDLQGLRSGKYNDTIAMENSTGKMYCRGFDQLGRPIIYMKPRKENSTDLVGPVRHLAYCMERAIACIDRQLSTGRLCGDINDTRSRKIVLFIDFSEVSLSTAPPISVSRDCVTMLQDHYPERLGQAFIIDHPWVVSAFFKALSPFVDPVTKEKFVFFTEDKQERKARMCQYFDLNTVETEFGGRENRPFKSSIFLGVASSASDGSVFGLDFSEQLELVQEGTAMILEDVPGASSIKLGTGKRQDARTKIPLDSILCDPFMIGLSRAERAAVRSFAISLSQLGLRDDEESYELYDDAGELFRFLSSASWDFAKAENRIRATARWRKSFAVLALREGDRAEAIAKENKAGRLYVRGYDRKGRPVVHIKLRHADLGRRSDTVLHAVYCLERAITCTRVPASKMDGESRLPRHTRVASDGKILFLVDFDGYSRNNRPSIQSVREIIAILQQYYPERFGDCILLNPPMQVCFLWRFLSWFVEAETQRKIHVCNGTGKQLAAQLASFLDEDTLEASLGGRPTSPFDSDIFLHTDTDGREVFGTEFEEQVGFIKAERQAKKTDSAS